MPYQFPCTYGEAVSVMDTYDKYILELCEMHNAETCDTKLTLQHFYLQTIRHKMADLEMWQMTEDLLEYLRAQI